MPWGWDSRGPVNAALGGDVGTADEAGVGHAWPNYEATYLKHRLRDGTGKYSTAGLPSSYVNTYLDKVSAGYKEEADECLRHEFNDWLQGKHSDNLAPAAYANGPGRPRRSVVFREGTRAVTEAWDNTRDGEWKPTWWKTDALTHLPGVRDYLRTQETKGKAAEIEMNLLAEYGPQDLESAWQYFKHWVKARPVGPESCPDDKFPWNQPDKRVITRRSDYGNMPHHLRDRPLPPMRDTELTDTDVLGREVAETIDIAFGSEDAEMEEEEIQFEDNLDPLIQELAENYGSEDGLDEVDQSIDASF